MSTRTLLTPGTLSPRREVPAHIPRPEYVGKAGARAAAPDPDVQTPEIIEKMRVAGRIAAQALAGGRRGRRARRDHRRDRPGRARVPRRPRRLPVDAGLQGLPEVVLHQPERGHLPRHPGLHRDRGRRHRQHRRHRVHRRRARRHQRHLPAPATSTRRTGCWSSAPTRRPCAAIKAVAPGRAAQRHRPGHRVATPSGSATAWCATSPATASAATSTPAWSSCTTTTRR